MKRISQTIKVVLALFVATFSNGLLPAAQASAYSSNQYGNHDKVFVCKYVGTPGVDETLKSGKNPISVDNHNYSIGSYFNDGQGRSYVVAWDNGGQEPPVSMCPTPTTTIPVPATPSVNDPCGSGNATWVAPVDTAQIDWVLLGNGDLVANTKAGYEFSTGNKTSHNYGKAVDSNVPCIVSIPVPATPSANDPCGLGNAAWVVPSDTAQIDWTLKANGDLVADTKSGFVFADQTTTHNYGKVVDSNVLCIVTIPVPATPSVNDPCGYNNATWIVPNDTEKIDWVLLGNGDLVANTKAGYEFSTGNKTSHNYGKAVDSGKRCEVPVPTTPSQNDPCGVYNATWNIPENTVAVTWSLVNGHLIASANNGYIFTDHTYSHDYGKAHDSGKPCIVTIPVPGTPDTKDPCGKYNAEWIVPHDTFQIDWSVNYKGELIATTKSGFIFPDEQHSHNYGKAHDSGKLCEATPKKPMFVDYCGTRPDYVLIPEVRGVTYFINGHEVHSGQHKVTGTVVVTAEANHDYIFDEETTSEWTYTFKDDECISITKVALPVTDTNEDGLIGLGDVVTWQITVTNNSDNKLDNFKVQIEDSTATLENDGLINELSPGESVTLTATSTITTTDLKVCKVANTADFTAWYLKKDHHHHHIDNDGRDDNRFSYLGEESDDEDSYNLAGSASAEATFTCPTPGSGDGGGETPTPTPTPTTTSEELPTVLPSTGPSSSGSPFAILLAAVVAYGATYFLQRRRETSDI